MKQALYKSSLGSETKRVGKFGAVGIINTIIDFSIFNLLIEIFGLHRIIANMISTSSAMMFSFFANKKFVFRSDSKKLGRQILIFFPVTAFGLYVIQNGIIYTLTELWTGPLDLAYSLVQALTLDNLINQEFVINNGAKAIATVASLAWNYLMYKYIVFKT